MKPWTRERLQEIADATWTELMQFCNPDSCVLGTRLLQDVLQRLGERDSYGLCVTALLLNPAAREHAQAHCGVGILACDERKEPMLVVGIGENPDAPARGFVESWSGHVALAVQRRWIIDISVAQAARPEQGLPIEAPIVMPTSEAFLRGRAAATLELVPDDDGARAIRAYYQARPNASRAWRESPDWAWDTELRDHLAQATLARLSGNTHAYPDWLEIMRTSEVRV